MTENSHQSGDLAQRKVRLGDLLVQTGLISEAQLQLALQGFVLSGATDDVAEGLQAWREKREPDWRGR